MAFIGVTATASAFAETAPVAGQQNASGSMQMAANTMPSVGAAGQWASQSGPAAIGKTRAQVYREMVHAEKDGQLDYLQSVVYAH